jgi:hypothetical protein
MPNAKFSLTVFYKTDYILGGFSVSIDGHFKKALSSRTSQHYEEGT